MLKVKILLMVPSPALRSFTASVTRGTPSSSATHCYESRNPFENADCHNHLLRCMRSLPADKNDNGNQSEKPNIPHIVTVRVFFSAKSSVAAGCAGASGWTQRTFNLCTSSNDCQFSVIEKWLPRMILSWRWLQPLKCY